MGPFLIELLIGTAISIIVMGLLYYFVRPVFRILSIIFLISLVIMTFITVFVVMDIIDFKNHATDGNKFVLEKDGKIVAGFLIGNGTDPLPLSFSEVNELDLNYQNKNYELMKMSAYKLFVFQFNSTKKDVSFLGFTYTKESIAIEMDSNDTSSQTIKNMLFFAMIYENLQSGPFYLLEEYRQEHIVIYPETALFKFMKYIPSSILESAKELSTKPAKEDSIKESSA